MAIGHNEWSKQCNLNSLVKACQSSVLNIMPTEVPIYGLAFALTHSLFCSFTFFFFLSLNNFLCFMTPPFLHTSYSFLFFQFLFPSNLTSLILILHAIIIELLILCRETRGVCVYIYMCVCVYWPIGISVCQWFRKPGFTPRLSYQKLKK